MAWGRVGWEKSDNIWHSGVGKSKNRDWVLLIKEKWLENVTWWWWIFFVVWLTEESRLALFPAGNTLKNSKQEKVLGVTIDNKLNFAKHLLNITKNANIKFNALTRVQKCMTTD